MTLDRRRLAMGIVAYWSAWFFIVFGTNACDGLKAMGALPAGWQFASGNFAFMTSVTARYHLPTPVTAILFLGVVCWELTAAVLFLRATVLMRAEASRRSQAVQWAFAVGLGLWAVFTLMDEIFIIYSVEATHMQLFIAQLISLWFIEKMSPEELSSGGTGSAGECSPK